MSGYLESLNYNYLFLMKQRERQLFRKTTEKFIFCLILDKTKSS